MNLLPVAPLLLPAPSYTDSVYAMDALALCAALPERSVDMVLADLPYGTTACSWDEVIPFEPLWAAFKRIIKPKGAIVLTASQPFTSRLVMSNLADFRYEWVWDKATVIGYLDAHRRPLKRHESVLVFCQSGAPYYPQMERGKPYSVANRVPATVYGKHYKHDTINNGTRFPTTIIDVPNPQTRYHPTQKPVDLFAYLIRTYTRPGDLVCDPTCGSGTTALAARNTGRHYIVGDNDPHWCDVTRQRLATPYTLPLFTDEPQPVAAVQAALFDIENLLADVEVAI